MSASDDASKEFEGGDETRRVRRVVKEEISGPNAAIGALEKNAKTFKVLIGFIVFIFSAGFGFSLYVGTFARAADVAKLSKKLDEQAGKIDDQADKLDSHILQEKIRQDAFERAQQRIEREHDWERDQLYELAKTVGARRIPAPKHE